LDKIERFKLVITFAICSLFICTSQNKPFNPLLGETHQGTFEDGTRFYCEHTSHHPPITNFLVEGKAFKMHGYFEFSGGMGTNSLTTSLTGPTHIEFSDGQKISFSGLNFLIGGTVMGERTIEPTGDILFEDVKNNIRAILHFNTYASSGYWTVTEEGGKDLFVGVLYKSSDIKEPTKMDKQIQFPTNLQEIPHMVQKIDDINGSIIENVIIGGKAYWEISDFEPKR